MNFFMLVMLDDYFEFLTICNVYVKVDYINGSDIYYIIVPMYDKHL